MHCVIVGAAEISNYKKIKENIPADSFVIYCDGGLKHLEKLGIEPSLIVGDFDSYPFPENMKTVEIIKLPCVKDDTDTFFAVKEAVRRGFDQFILAGVIGQRFDHSLCNISILLWLYEKGFSAKLIDDYSTMQIIGPETMDKPFEVCDDCDYFSLMLPGGEVKGVTIKNAKYPLDNADIKPSYQYGISNEVVKGKKAQISVKEGVLLFMKI